MKICDVCLYVWKLHKKTWRFTLVSGVFVEHMAVPYCSGIIDWKKEFIGFVILALSLSLSLLAVTLPLTYPATLVLIYSQDPPLFHRDSFSDDFHPIHRILDSMYFVFLCRWWMFRVKTLLAIRRRRCDDGEAVRVRARRIEAQQSPALDLQPRASDWKPTADYLTTTLRYIPILAIHTNARYVFIPLMFK